MQAGTHLFSHSFRLDIQLLSCHIIIHLIIQPFPHPPSAPPMVQLLLADRGQDDLFPSLLSTRGQALPQICPVKLCIHTSPHSSHNLCPPSSGPYRCRAQVQSHKVDRSSIGRGRLASGAEGVEALDEVAAEGAQRRLLVDFAQADGAVDAEPVAAAVDGHVQLSFQADAAVVFLPGQFRLKAGDRGRARVVPHRSLTCLATPAAPACTTTATISFK